VDTEKQMQQVEEITDTDYFRHLQQRVQQIRSREPSGLLKRTESDKQP
jgi:hypothetical protein